MKPDLASPAEAARREAEALRNEPAHTPQARLDRVLGDASFIDAESLIVGLEDFNRERMQRIPSATEYPESPPWVEHILAVDRELQQLPGMSDRDLALYRSLGAFLSFRGYAAAKPAMTEKCRVAYLPESDHGQIHIKNVDDPATFWTARQGPPVSQAGTADFAEDGVGSGLHIDDEPDEICPLDARTMRPHYVEDVPGAIEFYTRYKVFWGGCNIVVHDRQKRSAAIEKCSRNFIEVFHPGPDGRSHCSGMACRDPESPQGRYQREKRQQYLTAFDQPTDGPDQTFWDACDRAEQMLAQGLQDFGAEASLDALLKLFLTPFPEGLCKDGIRLHPDQATIEYTLVTGCALIDEKRSLRWQRDPQTLKMPAGPEEFQF